MRRGTTNALQGRSLIKVFPEHYLIDVNRFDALVKDPLDEWIDFLKNQRIADTPGAPGLAKARMVFDVMGFTNSLKWDFDHFQASWRKGVSELETARQEGFAQGLAQARAKVLGA